MAVVIVVTTSFSTFYLSRSSSTHGPSVMDLGVDVCSAVVVQYTGH